MRLRRWMANRRLRTKFVLILMAAMLLVFAITLATMRIPYAAYDQQLYNSSTQLITLFADRIQGELENIEALSFRMLADNVLQESLRDMLDKPITTSSWMEARTNVGERISYFSVWSDSVLALRIKTANGISLGQALGTTYTMGEITPAQVAQAAEETGRPVWQVEDGEPCPALSGAGDTGDRMAHPAPPGHAADSNGPEGAGKQAPYQHGPPGYAPYLRHLQRGYLPVLPATRASASCPPGRMATRP